MRVFPLIAAAALFASASFASPAVVPTIGVEGELEMLLPVADLKTVPFNRASPVTLRIASSRPHGTLTYYDLRYIGLVSGEYDLRKLLINQDGSAAADLPEMKVRVAGILPPTHQGELSLQPDTPLGRLGGYKVLMGGIVGLWAIVALPLLVLGRRIKAVEVAAPPPQPLTLLERMRPLVELAAAGKLNADEKAQLERMLLAHWRERLELQDLDPPDAIAKLKEHPEAGALLRALEDWLHRPPGTVKVDLEAVLATCREPQLTAESAALAATS